MRRLLMFPLLAILAIPLWAQEASEPETEAAEPPSAESTESVEKSADETGADEEELDESYTEEDEDKFIPSEDVAFGQSIPFPTDI